MLEPTCKEVRIAIYIGTEEEIKLNLEERNVTIDTLEALARALDKLYNSTKLIEIEVTEIRSFVYKRRS